MGELDIQVPGSADGMRLTSVSPHSEVDAKWERFSTVASRVVNETDQNGFAIFDARVIRGSGSRITSMQVRSQSQSSYGRSTDRQDANHEGLAH